MKHISIDLMSTLGSAHQIEIYLIQPIQTAIPLLNVDMHHAHCVIYVWNMENDHQLALCN